MEGENYFDIVVGKGPESFTTVFERHWLSAVKQISARYGNSAQLHDGSRLRPILVCWGYILSNKKVTTESIERVAKLAIAVEMLHKGSILVDDVIDNDQARHGKEAFHVEHSRNEAILFAIYLLTYSLEHIHNCFKQTSASVPAYTEKIGLFVDTIRSMSIGALDEIKYSQSDLTVVSNVSRLINLETVSMIKNCLLLGYLVEGEKEKNSDLIEKVGSLSGYAFQMLNDLEPFSSKDETTIHKGLNNIDICRSRKNIVVAYLYELMNSEEKENLRQLMSQSHFSEHKVFQQFKMLFEKYKIDDVIINEVKDFHSKINLTLTELELSEIEQDRLNAFRMFVNLVFVQCLQRLDNKYYMKLSPILMT